MHESDVHQIPFSWLRGRLGGATNENAGERRPNRRPHRRRHLNSGHSLREASCPWRSGSAVERSGGKEEARAGQRLDIVPTLGKHSMKAVKTNYAVVEAEPNDGGEDMNFDELFHNGDTPTKAAAETQDTLKGARAPRGRRRGARCWARAGTSTRRASRRPRRSCTRRRGSPRGHRRATRTSCARRAASTRRNRRRIPGQGRRARRTCGRKSPAAATRPEIPLARTEHQPGASRRVAGAGVGAHQVPAHVEPHLGAGRRVASTHRLRSAAQHHEGRPEQADRGEEEAHAG